MANEIAAQIPYEQIININVALTRSGLDISAAPALNIYVNFLMTVQNQVLVQPKRGDYITLETSVNGIDGIYRLASGVEDMGTYHRVKIDTTNFTLIQSKAFANSTQLATATGRIYFGKVSAAGTGGTLTTLFSTDLGKAVGLIAGAIVLIMLVRYLIK